MELWISTNCTIQGIHRLRKGKIAKEQKESESFNKYAIYNFSPCKAK